MISLQKIRSPYVMKWGLWAIIIITIPSFVALYGFAPPQKHGGVDMSSLVKVRGASGVIELGREDLARAKNEAVSYYSELAALAFGVPREQMGQVQQAINGAISTMEAIDFAVLGVAMRERLEKQDLRVSDRQVSSLLRRQGITRERLREMLGGRMSEYEYAAIVRDQITRDMARRTVSRAARTSLLELWQEYLLQNEKLTVDFVRLTIEPEEDMIVPTEKVVELYEKWRAERNPAVIEPAKRVYRHVTFPAPPPAFVNPTDEQLKAAYDAAVVAGESIIKAQPGVRVRQILQPVTERMDLTARLVARAAVEAARVRIEAGEDFATVANELSQDPRNLRFTDADSSPTLLGGLLPYMLEGTEVVAWGDKYMEFVKTAEVGATSGVLETPQGFVLARVESRTTDSVLTFDEAKEALRQRVTEQLRAEAARAREAQIAANLERLRNAVASETTLEGIARAVGLSVETTSPTIATQTFIPGIGSLSREAETLKNLTPRLISPVLQSNNGAVTVLSIAEIIPEDFRPMDMVRASLERAIKRNVAVQEAELRASKLRDAVRAGDLLTSAALTMGLVASSPEPFTRSELPEELRAVTELELRLTSARKGDFFIVRGGSPAFVTEVIAIAVKDVSEPQISDFLANIQSLERSLLMAKQQGYLEEFRTDAIAMMRPEIDTDFIPAETQQEHRRLMGQKL